MAIVDRETGHAVLRLVYDGLPLSGKTTTLQALAESFKRPLYSPEERQGRTYYFDWLDHVGGSWRGRRLRCQIVSVPGQPGLGWRRRWLVSGADAVVSVLDSSAERIAASVERLAELHRALDRVDGPPVGIVAQLNKRDLQDAVARDRVQELLAREGPPVALVESVATHAEGTRVAFVLAVQLALDRLNLLAGQGMLEEGEPDIASGEELLEHIRLEEAERFRARQESRQSADEKTEAAAVGEPGAPSPRSGQGNPEPSAVRPSAETWPRMLTTELPSEHIWPPVHGRLILQRALATAPRWSHQGTPAAANDGAREPEADPGRQGRAGSWWLVSPPGAEAKDADRGRRRLVEWARAHTAVEALLSPHRCLVLARLSGDELRLWSVASRVPPLEEALAGLLETREVAAAVAAVVKLAREVSRTQEVLRAAAAAAVVLPGIGSGRPQPWGVWQGRLVYRGVVPLPGDSPSEGGLDEAGDLMAGFGSLLESLWAQPTSAPPAVSREAFRGGLEPWVGTGGEPAVPAGDPARSAARRLVEILDSAREPVA